MGDIKEKEIKLDPIGDNLKDNSPTGDQELSRRENISKKNGKRSKRTDLGSTFRMDHLRGLNLSRSSKITSLKCRISS